MKKKARPIPIDFTNNVWDRKVKKMGMKYTAGVVAAVTGLTKSQVMGRRRKAGITSNLKYRQGLTEKAKQDLKRMDKLYGDAVKMQRMIKKLLRGNRREEAKAKRYFMRIAG